VQPTDTFSGRPHDVSAACGGNQILYNYGDSSYGAMSVRNGTWNSVNTVYTRLILQVGVAETMQTASALGLAMPAYDPANHCASVALGFLDVTPLAMASAFGTFANHGRRAPPTPILRVTDANGNNLIDNTMAGEQAQQVIAEPVADNVTDILRGVLTDGTAADNGIDRPAAGKTGTAEDEGNAWFVGFTPTLSTAVWMGYLQCNCPLHGINGVRRMTGGAVPAETWERVMRRALQGVPVTEFAEPAPIVKPSDEQVRRQRNGFDPGAPRRRDGTPAGSYVDDLSPPVAEAPTTTTSTTTPPTTTTVTRPITTTTKFSLIPPTTYR
ncbi:MAG: penicillin-binding transpeptidase domain-containing protein, partial [Acidimicrobiales bacterium]